MVKERLWRERMMLLGFVPHPNRTVLKNGKRDQNSCGGGFYDFWLHELYL
jgi:hypothetical protein